MKSGFSRILTTLVAVASLVAAYFAAEFYHQSSSSALAQSLVSESTRELLSGGDPRAIPALADTGANVAVPDVAFLSRFGDLIAMETPAGDIFVPPLFSSSPGTASLTLRASFAYGTADIQTQLSYREGEWRLLSYTLTPGAGVM